VEKMVRSEASRRTGKARRAERYATLADLRAAVRAKCIAEVDQLMGAPGAGQEVEALVRRGGPPDDRARRVWRALMKALADASDLLATNPDGPWAPKYEFDIAMFLMPERFWRALPEKCGHVIRAKAHNARARLAADLAGPELEDMDRRTWLVAYWDQHGLLWWHASARLPTPREIALLSLLAGEFPEHARRRQCKGVQPTVAEVIEAEMRAIRLARDRIAKWKVESLIRGFDAPRERAEGIARALGIPSATIDRIFRKRAARAR
jgi:hypothetical protein